jgi:hypothetical protein
MVYALVTMVRPASLADWKGTSVSWPALLATGLWLAGSPAQAAEHMGDHSFYFGELHAHTGWSGDGGSSDVGDCPTGDCADFADFYDIARDDAGLDFAAITDHLNWGAAISDIGWASIIQLTIEADEASEGTGFLPLLAGEQNFKNRADLELGHKNVIFFGAPAEYEAVELQQVSLTTDFPACEDTETWAEELEAELGPLLIIPHHPAASVPVPVDWSCHDPLRSPVVELYSAHGNSLDNPNPDSYDPLAVDSTPSSVIIAALDPDRWSHHLGFIGGTDFHDSMPGSVCHLDGHQTEQPYGGGLTGVFLDASCEWTRSSLLGALRQRHSYATSGPKEPVLLELLDPHDGALGVAGDIIAPAPTGQTTAQVSIPAALEPHVLWVELRSSTEEATRLTASGDGVYELTINPVSPPWYGFAVVALDGASYYAAQGITCTDDRDGKDSNERLWTSPIWLEDQDETDDDNDGWAESEGDCDDSDPARFPGADEQLNCVDDDCDGEVDEGLGPDDTDDTDDPHTDTDPGQDDTADSDGDSDSPPDDTSGEIEPEKPGCACAESPDLRSVVGSTLCLLGLALVWRRKPTS